MVLEHIFPEEWLEKRGVYAFLLGVGYSILGILFASILFPADPALVAVAFISLLLLPELYKLFSIEERMEDRELKFTIKELYLDNKLFVKTYLMLFLGILLVFSSATMFLSTFQTNNLFREQLEMREIGSPGVVVKGPLTFSTDLFVSIFRNNFMVLFFCFLLSFLTGDGAIFLIVWNASVWGTIFGITAKNAAISSGANPLFYFAIIMIIVLPHLVLEALSYIMAATSGGVISKDVLLEKFDSDRFKEVFVYNFWLFIFAIGVLVIGALVETYVLDNIYVYAEIISKSMMIV